MRWLECISPYTKPAPHGEMFGLWFVPASAVPLSQCNTPLDSVYLKWPGKSIRQSLAFVEWSLLDSIRTLPHAAQGALPCPPGSALHCTQEQWNALEQWAVEWQRYHGCTNHTLPSLKGNVNRAPGNLLPIHIELWASPELTLSIRNRSQNGESFVNPLCFANDFQNHSKKKTGKVLLWQFCSSSLSERNFSIGSSKMHKTQRETQTIIQSPVSQFIVLDFSISTLFCIFF